METLAQILPQFKDVKLVTDRDDCNRIRAAEQQSQSAWLLDEKASVWEFIERLDEEDAKSDSPTPLNLYDLHVARNVNFPCDSVALVKDGKFLRGEKNLSELLSDLIKFGNGKFVVLVKKGASTAALKLKILQQFICLRIFLPIIITATFENFAQPSMQATGDLGIFGTKKAGKSALVNALLGDEYAVSSPVLPTPNQVIYVGAPKSVTEISLTCKNATRSFQNAAALRKFLSEENSLANKNFSTLDEMTIAVPNFPPFLNGARLIDTPGTNFAVAKDHAEITLKTLSQVSHAIFVMNYSQYLTKDELKLFERVYKRFNNAEVQKPVLVVINRVDEIFASDEPKSYEHVADYIHYRLTALGYENFLVVGVSSLQSVYFDSITKLIAPEPRSFLERVKNFFRRFFVKPLPFSERLKALKADYRGTDKISAVAFVTKIISDFEDFHGIKVVDIGDLQKINRVNYLKCLTAHLIRGDI